jgi:cold shock CspA family protein
VDGVDEATRGEPDVQGVIKSYDPGTGDGVVVRDTDLVDVDLARDALEGSVFRMLRQGQRVVFELDAEGRATTLRLGSEVDMGTPGFTRDGVPIEPLPAGSLPDDNRPSALVEDESATDTTPTKVADDPSS